MSVVGRIDGPRMSTAAESFATATPQFDPHQVSLSQLTPSESVLTPGLTSPALLLERLRLAHGAAAPTAITFGWLAGKPIALALLLPVAATRTTPAASAAVRASAMLWRRLIEKLMLATSAPFAAAWLIELRIADTKKVEPSLMRIGMILHPPAAPATPRVLLATPAATPAHPVP